MVNQSKTNSQPRQIHPFFSKVASSGSSSAATSGPPSGTSHKEAPVSLDLTVPASPVAPLSSFLSAESLSTLHAEFASIPDLVTGTTPILESILGLESENDTEDDDSDDSSSGDNISGNTTSTENPSDSSLSGDSGNISVQFLKTVLASLKAEIETNNKPKIYSDGTFWHRPRDPVFALAMSNQEGNLNPRELYHLDVFVWILGLKNRLPGEPTQILCPTASCSGKLVRHGYNSNPIARPVRGLHRDNFLLTNRLRCEDCKKSFQGTDPKILEQLSRGLQESFPAFLTSRAAIDKALMSVMRACFATHFGPEPFSAMLSEMRHIDHSQRELMYLSAVKTTGMLIQEGFSKFDDKLQYAGSCPSIGYSKGIFVDWMQAHHPYFDRKIAALPASVLKGDHTFKVSFCCLNNMFCILG